MTDNSKTGNLVQILQNEDGTTDMLIDTGEDAEGQSGLKIFKGCYPVSVELGENDTAVIDGLNISCTFNYYPQQKLVDVVWPTRPEGGRGGNGNAISVYDCVLGQGSVLYGAGGAGYTGAEAIPVNGYGSFNASFEAEPVGDSVEKLREWEKAMREPIDWSALEKPSLFMRFSMWAAYANWPVIGMLSAIWAVVIYGFYLILTVPKVPL